MIINTIVIDAGSISGLRRGTAKPVMGSKRKICPLEGLAGVKQTAYGPHN
jgi:hypothetical protein